MEREALKKTIIAYMEIHNTLSLATEKDGAPHAATVFYVNTGFEIYFFKQPLDAAWRAPCAQSEGICHHRRGLFQLAFNKGNST